MMTAKISEKLDNVKYIHVNYVVELVNNDEKCI